MNTVLPTEPAQGHKSCREALNLKSNIGGEGRSNTEKSVVRYGKRTGGKRLAYTLVSGEALIRESTKVGVVILLA